MQAAVGGRSRVAARYAVDNYAGIKQMRLIGRQTSNGPLDVTVKKIGG